MYLRYFMPFQVPEHLFNENRSIIEAWEKKSWQGSIQATLFCVPGLGGLELLAAALGFLAGRGERELASWEGEAGPRTTWKSQGKSLIFRMFHFSSPLPPAEERLFFRQSFVNRSYRSIRNLWTSSLQAKRESLAGNEKRVSEYTRQTNEISRTLGGWRNQLDASRRFVSAIDASVLCASRAVILLPLIIPPP